MSVPLPPNRGFRELFLTSAQSSAHRGFYIQGSIWKVKEIVPLNRHGLQSLNY